MLLDFSCYFYSSVGICMSSIGWLNFCFIFLKLFSFNTGVYNVQEGANSEQSQTIDFPNLLYVSHSLMPTKAWEKILEKVHHSSVNCSCNSRLIGMTCVSQEARSTLLNTRGKYRVAEKSMAGIWKVPKGGQTLEKVMALGRQPWA